MDDSLKQARDHVLVENTAQAVFRHLDRLQDHRATFGTRWIWELLQNARDAAPLSGVVIDIRLTAHELRVRHDGRAFASEEIAHLIYHGSTKVDVEESVGHLGSGFLSTHLLSPAVRVRGQLEDGRPFDFTLDRTGATVEELRQAMDRSWDGFEQSVEKTREDDGGHPTEFVYGLDDYAVSVARAGIGHLRRLGALVIAFSPEIQEILIAAASETWRIARGPREPLGDNLEMLHVECEEGGEATSRSVVIAGGMDEVQAAIPLVRTPAGLTADLDEQTPRLFIEFPLLGTERLGLPAVVNSRQFKPREDRDGIVLDGDSDGIRQNRRLLEESVRHMGDLLEYVARTSLGGAERLLAFDGSRLPDWVDPKWFPQYLRVLVERARQIPLMTTVAGHRIEPRESWIPWADDERRRDTLWNLAVRWKDSASFLPPKNTIHSWSFNLSNWARLLETEPAALSEAFTIAKLAKLVDAAGVIDGVQARLAESGGEVREWLAEFLVNVVESGGTKLFDEFSLLPNQAGRFRKRSDLMLDRGIGGDLKRIALVFDIDLYSTLLDPNAAVGGLDVLLTPKREDEALDETLHALKQHCQEGRLSTDLAPHDAALFWLIASEDSYLDRLNGFPIIAAEEHDGFVTVLELKPNADPRPLAPVPLWPEGARSFAALFPHRRILSSALDESGGQGDVWAKFEQQGYVHLSPLYETRRRIQGFLPDHLEGDDTESHKTSEAIAVSDIALLAEEDIGVIDAVRRSRTRAIQFVRFLTDFVVEEDQHAFEKVSVQCECGNTHSLHRAAWLIPLHKRRWVPLPSDLRRSGRVSAEALADLLDADPDLIRRLAGERGSNLLQALGVSPADFHLRVVAKDEATRFALVRSMGDLAQAAGGSIERVRALVSEIREHPEIIQTIEDQQALRATVLRNHRLGRLVEELLKEALRERGVVVRRTGVGSDFEVESDFTENDEEVLLELVAGASATLIEVKSARTDHVRMTPVQAAKACETDLSFALCVVPLEDESPTQEIVLAQSRFVFGIGERLEPLLREYVSLREATNDARLHRGPVGIEITEGQARFRIEREIWVDGLKLPEAVKEIERRSQPTR